MRLTCPTCGAGYEVPEGAIPTGGKHVQCTACHTRWFARAGDRAALSEAQIIARLEGRRPRPRLVPAPDAGPEPEQSDPAPESGAEIPAAPQVDAAGPAADRIPAGGAGAAPPPAGISQARPAPPAPAPDPAPAPLREPLGDPPEAAPEVATGAAPAGPGHSRFGRGLAVALILSALALAAYLFADALAEAAPPAAPALDAYARWIDGLRDRAGTMLP